MRFAQMRGSSHPGSAINGLFILLLSVCLYSCSRSTEGDPNDAGKSNPPSVDVEDESVLDEPIKPIPLNHNMDADKVTLGKKLFHDASLSKDGSLSCASCHNLNLGGTDRKRFSTGVHGSMGSINSPTVFNSSLNFRQFWDGRAETLEEQIDGPLINVDEMGITWDEAIDKVKANPEYVSGFEKLYPEGVEKRTIQDAIAVFERSLITPNSRFDQYLRGDEDAINEEEKEGYRLFKAYGCISCHQGVAVGGNMFEQLGSMFDYFEDRGNVTESDYGRFNVTGREEDRYVFKVPSLRNVALTPPYFHDGTAKRLDDAVRVMAKYQLGRSLEDEEVELIVKFLNTLTGEYEGKPL